jgi:hypothetical protein
MLIGCLKIKYKNVSIVIKMLSSAAKLGEIFLEIERMLRFCPNPWVFLGFQTLLVVLFSEVRF